VIEGKQVCGQRAMIAMVKFRAPRESYNPIKISGAATNTAFGDTFLHF
jgi:hypothetical protein